MSVMGRRRQEEAILEAPREVSYCPRHSAFDGIGLSQGGCGVVRFVEDEQRSTAKLAQKRAQGGHVRLVREKRMRDGEA